MNQALKLHEITTYSAASLTKDKLSQVDSV